MVFGAIHIRTCEFVARGCVSDGNNNRGFPMGSIISEWGDDVVLLRFFFLWVKSALNTQRSPVSC